MKKIRLLSMLMFIALISMSLQSYSQDEAVDFADIVTVMEVSTVTGNLPVIIDDSGATRGAAFNGEYAFVATRKDGNHVYYWDVNNPDAAPEELSMTDVAGGYFVINDITTAGNHIFLSNMAFVDGNFKVYHWAGVDAEPTVLIDYADITVRLGDAISVVGDPDVAATLYASGYGSQDVYAWQIENGALVSATPEVITFADWANVSFARITASDVGDDYSLLSGPLGVAVVDDQNNVSLNIEQAFFPAWPMYAKAFEYQGGRYLSFIHVKGDPAENMLYVLDISEGADLLSAMTTLSEGVFADAVVHTADLGSVANLNASVSNDVVIDPDGNLWLMGYAAGNGFIVQKLSDESVAEPLVYSISIPLAPGQVQYKYFATMGEPGWDMGEWVGDPNRIITVQNDTTVTDTWAVQPQVDTVSVDSEDVEYIVTFTVDMANAVVALGDSTFAFDPEVHQLYIAGSFGGDLEWNEPGSNPALEMTIGDTGVVSVPELEVDNVQLKVFPNPASSQFTISAQTRINQVLVSDITGRTIKSVKADDLQLNFDTSGMNNGIYIISVYTEEGVTVSKLQIQR